MSAEWRGWEGQWSDPKDASLRPTGYRRVEALQVLWIAWSFLSQRTPTVCSERERVGKPWQQREAGPSASLQHWILGRSNRRVQGWQSKVRACLILLAAQFRFPSLSSLCLSLYGSRLSGPVSVFWDPTWTVFPSFWVFPRLVHLVRPTSLQPRGWNLDFLIPFPRETVRLAWLQVPRWTVSPMLLPVPLDWWVILGPWQWCVFH